MLPMAERPVVTLNICTLQPWEDDSLQFILRVRLYLSSRYRFRLFSRTRFFAGDAKKFDVFSSRVINVL